MFWRRDTDSGIRPLSPEPGPSKRERHDARGFSGYAGSARAALVMDANPMAGMSLLLLLLVIVCAVVWADRAVLDEVTRGEGVVVPSSREQVVQSLEGGILAEMLVKEGDVVEQGQTLLRIDDTRASASLNEAEARRWALDAKLARLRAESDGERPQFDLGIPADVVQLERKLYRSRREALGEALAALTRSYNLAREELELTAPLVADGAVSQVEVLRLRRQVNELGGQIQDRRNAFRADARSRSAEVESELAQLQESTRARADEVRRTVLTAPARGTVKSIRTTTIGGVIAPGRPIMEIVPLEDRLLVEARIRPKDVAFLHPGLPATVKITAYDYSIYGSLKGRLEQISADTIDDDRPGGESFFRIRVGTDTAALEGASGSLPIIPGMTATVEVLTGRKTVLDYLLKPVLKLRGRALSER